MASYEEICERVRQKRFEQEVAKVDNEYLRRFSESAGSYLDSAKKQYDSLGYGNAYQSYLNRRDSYNDLDYRRRVIQEWSKRNPGALDQQSTSWLDSFGKDSKGILDAFSGMQKYFSQFDSEDSYKQFLADQERWSKLTDGYDPTANAREGRAGWQRYQASLAGAPKQDATEDPKYWWRQLGSYGIGTPDTALAQLNTQQVANLYRQMDTALGGPDSRWSQEQQETFGYLWSRDPRKAENYARALNEMLNAQQEQAAREAIRDKATGSFGAGLAHTAGAILAGATGLADFQGDLIRKGATGSIPTADGYVSPFEYSQEVTGGIGQHLNEKYGTIDEGKFILGGKGLGDLYGLGVSAAQSMTYGKLMGQVPTLITFFGSGAASAVDEAKARGASDEQALTFGAISGAAEVLTEMVPLDHLLNMGRAQDLKGLFWEVTKQGWEEFGGEGLNSIITSIADYFTFGEMSTYNMAKREYMANGMSEEEASKRAFRDIAEDIAFDALGGFVTGTSSAGVQMGGATALHNAWTKRNYGPFQKELVQETLGLDPENTFAQKMQHRLERGKNLSGGQLSRLNDQIVESDIQAIQSAAANRLNELGETGDVDKLASALAKQAAGGELSKTEERVIQSSKYGQQVSNELNAENIRSGKYDSGWAEQIGTHRINAKEYGRMLHAAQQSENADTTEGDATVPGNRAVAKNATAEEVEAVGDNLSATDEESTEVQAVSLEEAAKGYGDQAQAMIHTYQKGQDVAKYDAAYRAAFDMGRSGVNIDYAMKSPSAAYLTEGQRGLAYEAGEAAANTAAHTRQAEIQAAANGKTGHRKGGLVRGEGVTIADLKKAVGDSRGTAYKTLSTIAKVTGIDIVLYKSKADGIGKFQGAQGEYDRSKPGTIYIDINAGLSHINDVNDLAKYTTLRTFSHEFTHFIENWNPVQYNEFRGVVFDTLTQRGEDVEFLIAQRQESGMDYDTASREVVAEAMTDILPDAAFVETLANEHKTIFQKLLDKLKEFTAKVREYFASIGTNRSREANALKEQVGDTVKYLERIVNLFDSVAVEAVHNYQLTVAAEEVALSEMESTTEGDQAVAYKNEATEEIAQVEDTVGDDHATTDDATISEAETVEADNTQENSNNATEDSDNETVAAETEAPAEETAIPPKAETEEAKQDLRKAVRMPIQGTNMEALLEGIKNRELSMESVTLSGSVEGFNAEQRQHLVEKLLEGVYTDAETIRIDVPYDGKFEIVNTPGNVAKVLENLKVKVRQEILFDKKTISLLTSNGDVRIVDLDGKKYLTNSYVMLPATEAAVEYAKAELKGRENQLHPEVAKAFENANNPLVDAPTEAKLGKTPVLIFNVDGKKLFFDKRLFSPLDGGKLYYADIRGTGILKSVDASGNVMGYLMGIRPNGKTEVTGEKPSNLKSYPKKKAQETAAQKEKPTQKPKSEPKPKAAPKTTAAKAPKPATVETSVKLEDFGEKIGGARKDQWSKRGLLAEDLTEMNDREREKNVKKDNVWKRPDYRKLIEGGADRNILYVRNEIRKALNQNIAYPYRVSDARKQQMQEEFVATVRAIQEMAEKVTTKTELAAMGRPWLMEHGYRTENSFTEKWRKNAALQGTNYVQTIEHLVRNWDQLGKLADKANFAVDAEKKIPSGFSIHEDDSNHTWFIARGNWVVRHSIPSYEEALSYLQNAASKTKKKTRFVPEQLLEVHRKGPNYRGGKDVKGQDYLDTFGFKGGEFGNWMTEKDRRVSMNYGFDALKDLADALGIADMDISLAGNLSIAFGARGQGLSGAAAHYEQERHVINLTKMNGAGSLAHEWFHALDDFLGGYGSKFATEYGSKLPETTKAAMRHLLTTMQYRDATQEETDMAATKAYEQAKRSVTYQVSNQFGWVRRIEEGKFQESDARYYSRKPTESDVKKYHELLDKLLETGDMAVLEELSALRKEVAGHVIPKEDRESIGYRLHSLRPDATKNVQKMRLRSDFYNNSRRFGELHHKDGDYWDSTIEMAARAFACYVADKTGKHNDYLSAHSDTAVTLDMDKDGNVSVVRAFPVGEERVQINAAFDQLIAALKEDGFLHEQGETVKPEMIQYQRRSNSENVQNPYDGKSLYGDEEIYRYDFMTAQPDMAVAEMPSLSDVKSGNKVDQKKAVELGLSNAMNLGRQVGENQYAIRNAYTGREIIVGTSGLSHGLSGENVNRLRTNARLAAIGGTIVQNAIPINGLKNKNRQASGTYAMACLLNSGDYHVVAIVTVEEHTSKAVGIDYVDITHSINGRILEKNIDSRSSTREMGHGQTSAPTTAIYNISIADLLDIVNKTHRSILSDDVLEFFNEERPDGGFYSDRVLHQERTSPLTDRDVLAMAVEDIPVDGLTDGEKDALRIFKSRLNTLQTLQEERAEQGRIYREQQFGTNVNREAAKQTLNRMHTLDSQIQRASAEVLDVEQKTVLREVLKKARRVVEKQQLAKDQQTLKNWRKRRNDADAIRKYRERLKADVSELTKWAVHPDNKNVVKHIPDALKQTVLPFLESIDFSSDSKLRGKNPTKADAVFLERAKALRNAMKPDQGSVEETYAGYTDLAPDFQDRLQKMIDNAQDIVNAKTGEFVVNRMTSEELKELSKIVRTLKVYIQKFNTFHYNAMFSHVHEAGDDSIDFLGKLKPAQHTGAVSEFLKWQQMRPAYAIERFGKGGMAIYDGLRRGQATLAFNTEKIKAFSDKAYTVREVRDWENQVKTIRLSDGETVKMKVSQIMSLYELSKRQQAVGHILGEGIRVATFRDKKGKISDVGRRITVEDLNTITDTLTKRQKEVADSLQKFMQEQGGAWGNHVTLARFGEKQFGEENYFPINSDGRHLSVNADEKPGNASLYALLNMGFTKQVQENAKNRIVVYSIFDVFANHMASMAQYHAFALPVVDALKWLNYKQTELDEDGNRTFLASVREEMDRVYGVPVENKTNSGKRGYAQNFVINIIKAFNGTEAQGTPYDGFGMQMLHKYNRAQVAFNLSTAVKQPLAILRAGVLLDYKSIAKGVKLNPDVVQKNIREMRKYSGIAAWKGLGFYDVNISRGLSAIIKHDETWQDKVTDTGMWAAEKADTWTWAAIWAACKEEVIAKQRITPRQEGFYEAVAQLFEDVIYKTQVVDSVLTKNEFMRDKGFFARSLSSFMSEPVTTASMVIDAFDKYQMDMQRGLTRQQAWKKNGRRMATVFYVYSVNALLTAAVSAAISAWRDDDDYQEWYEKWLEAFWGEGFVDGALFDELNPFTKLPGVADAYEVIESLMAPLLKAVWGVDLYTADQLTTFGQVAQYAEKAIDILADKISGENTKYQDWAVIYKLLQAASGALGLPMATAAREIVDMWNNTVGAMAPSLKVKTYDPGEKNEIKYAYQDGYLTFAEAREELLATGLSEKEVKQITDGWLAAELQSQDERVREAAMARVSGDFDRYKELFYEIKGEGNYEFDVIMSAINSEINKIEKGLPEEPTYKAPDRQYDDESVFGIADYYTSIINGDTQTAASIKNDLVAELMGEGYLKHEAMDSVESSFAAKVKTGYMSGTLDARQATELLKGYGGKTTEESKSEIEKWDFELAQGYSWGSRVRGYRLGHISKNDLISAVMAVEGASRDEAMDYIRFLDLEKANGNISITASDAAGYFEHAEPAGIKISVYLDYKKLASECTGQKDENGKTISGSKKAEVLAVIDSMPLTVEQKDALYFENGYAASTLHEAPWH